MAMAEIKYVAAGFLEDAERLLQDFVKEDSMEFSAFVKVWKRLNFALIYAFRPRGKELGEFTMEIFQLSTSFLKSGSLVYRVGAAFLLYALYRHQIMTPPLKIRITSSQLKSILELQSMSHANDNPSLHYVISYLVENSFDFVAFPKLKGPNSIVRSEANRDGYQYRPKIKESCVNSVLVDVAQSKSLLKVDEMFVQYEKAVQSLEIPFTTTAIKHPTCKELALRLDMFLNEGGDLDQGACTFPKNAESLAIQTKQGSTIGSRRALLKAAAFAQPVCPYLSQSENNAATSCVSEGVESAGDDAPPPKAPVRVVRRKRRVRKSQRKVGRPKKWVSDDCVSEVELEPTPDENLQAKGMSGRRHRRPRGQQFKKIRQYYMEDAAECDVLNLPSTSNYLSEQECLFSSSSSDSPGHL